MVCIRVSSALVLSIFFSAVAPWHILHLPLNKAAASSSVAMRAGTETKSAAATSGIPIKAAAIFFIIAVTFPPNYDLSDPQERSGFGNGCAAGGSVEKHNITRLRLRSFSQEIGKFPLGAHKAARNRGQESMRKIIEELRAGDLFSRRLSGMNT